MAISNVFGFVAKRWDNNPELSVKTRAYAMRHIGSRLFGEGTTYWCMHPDDMQYIKRCEVNNILYPGDIV